MRNRIIALILLGFGFFSGLRAQVPVLIPSPASLKTGSGFCRIPKSNTIGISFARSEWQAWLVPLNDWKTPSGKTWQLTGKQAFVQCELIPGLDTTFSRELYELEVDANRVRIRALSYEGIGNGLKTLVQLLEGAQNGQIPQVRIQDGPRFAWRGLMLDVSRHFFPAEDVKAYLREMARFKFNTFHWHLSDDQGWRLEIKSKPRLTSVGAWRVPRSGAFGNSERKPPQPGEKATYGGFYTQEQVKDIVAYAASLGIQVIPEIDIPGHCMALLAAYPELGCTKDTNIRVSPGSKFSEWYGNNTFKMLVENSLNPSDEKVYAFLDDVFKEVAALFPAPYIHVGGDECYKGFWEKDPGCRALMEKLNIRHSEDLQGYFMNRVQIIIKGYGKKTIGWDEVMEGGMSNEAVLMFWRGWMAKDLLPKVLKADYKVIFSPTSTNYFDYFQGEKTIEPPVYGGLRLQEAWNFNPVPDGFNEKNVLGGQSNLWTENVQNLKHAEYMTWPRAWATSEVLWDSKTSRPDWNTFVRKVEVQIDRSDRRGVRVSRAIYDPVVKYRREKGQVWVELSGEAPDLEFRYALDESMPDRFSALYSQPILIPAEGIQTLRIQAFRKGEPIGHLITLPNDVLRGKAK